MGAAPPLTGDSSLSSWPIQGECTYRRSQPIKRYSPWVMARAERPFLTKTADIADRSAA